MKPCDTDVLGRNIIYEIGVIAAIFQMAIFSYELRV